MNCIRCGQPLPPGAQSCPMCGQPYAPVSQPQPEQKVYPTAYSQSIQTREDNSFLTILSDLPRAFLHSFTQPGEVLRTMVEKRDHFSFPIVTVLVLLLSFLCGTVLLRGFVAVLYQVIYRLTGSSLAGSAASLSQGVSYITGRVGPMAGGIAVLCQLISMAALSAVFMVYLGAVCRLSLSYELVTGFITVISLNTVATTVLAMACSLLSPWLALMVMGCGLAVGLSQACGMLSLITGRPENRLFVSKLVLSAASVLAVLSINGVVGSLLMNGVLQRILGLLGSAGSLI